MSTKQQAAKASSKTLTDSRVRNSVEKLTPRQWNLVSQRLNGYSTQLSKSKGQVAKVHAVKPSKS